MNIDFVLRATQNKHFTGMRGKRVKPDLVVPDCVTGPMPISCVKLLIRHMLLLAMADGLAQG